MSKNLTTLSDTFSLKGRWWLPETPDRAIPGLLTFSPEGPTEVALDGTLRDTPKGPWKGFSSKVIRGQTVNGKACTLIDTFENASQLFSPGTATSKFFFNQMLIGNEFIDPQQTTFESCIVEFSDLGGWLHRDPFKDKHTLPIVTTEYIMPKLISIFVPPIDASLRFEGSINSNLVYQKRTLQHTDFLRIKPRKPRILAWHLDKMFKFRILLSLLVAQPVAIRSIRICTRPKRLPNLGPKPYRDYLDICLRPSGKLREKDLLPPEIPFTYPSLRKHMRKILKAWFAKVDTLSTVYGLHFGVQVNEGTPVEFRFLALLQALESFHRAHGHDNYMPIVKYQPVYNTLVAAIPKDVISDHRMSLKKRIEFGNEYSLRKRLSLTMKNLPSKLSDMITCGNTQFISQVVATRNYLTHRDESQKQDVLDFQGMFNASESLRLIIAFLLLREAGVPVPLAETTMLTHWKFQNRTRIV